MVFRRICGLVLALIIICGSAAFALKNVCNVCATVAQDDDLACKKCGTVINQCLDCGLRNPMKNDVCASCSANLDEMRSLGQIDPEVRDDLRLGKTDRSQLERAIGRLDNLMKKHPEQAETLLFRKGEVYFQLKNWGKAVSTWREYIATFPKSSRLPILQASLSEALCKIGWSRFEDRAPEEALARFEEATEANPLNDNAWRLVAQMHRELGQPEKAGDAYMKALEANPGHKSTIGLLRQMKRTIPPELLKPRPKPAPASATVQVQSPASASSPAPVAGSPASATSVAPVAPVVPAAPGGEVVVTPNVPDQPAAPGAVASIPPETAPVAPIAPDAPQAASATTVPPAPPTAPTPTSAPTPVPEPATTNPAAPASSAQIPATAPVTPPTGSAPAVPVTGPAPSAPSAPVPGSPIAPTTSQPQAPQAPVAPQVAPPAPAAAQPSSVASIPAPVSQP